jgi:hypothetical protein
MIALPRGVFERGGDVAIFQERVVVKNLLARRARSQQIQDVLDADAQIPQTGTPAALPRIDRDAVDFTHRLSPRSHDSYFTLLSVTTYFGAGGGRFAEGRARGQGLGAPVFYRSPRPRKTINQNASSVGCPFKRVRALKDLP